MQVASKDAMAQFGLTPKDAPIAIIHYTKPSDRKVRSFHPMAASSGLGCSCGRAHAHWAAAAAAVRHDQGGSGRWGRVGLAVPKEVAPPVLRRGAAREAQ